MESNQLSLKLSQPKYRWFDGGYNDESVIRLAGSSLKIYFIRDELSSEVLFTLKDVDSNTTLFYDDQEMTNPFLKIKKEENFFAFTSKAFPLLILFLLIVSSLLILQNKLLPIFLLCFLPVLILLPPIPFTTLYRIIDLQDSQVIGYIYEFSNWHNWKYISTVGVMNEQQEVMASGELTLFGMEKKSGLLKVFTGELEALELTNIDTLPSHPMLIGFSRDALTSLDRRLGLSLARVVLYYNDKLRGAYRNGF